MGAAMRQFAIHEIDPAKLSALGYDIGIRNGTLIVSLHCPAEMRSVFWYDHEAQEVLARCCHETPAQRATEFLAIALLFAIAAVAAPLFSGGM